MEQEQSQDSLLDLFESTGIGLVTVDDRDRVTDANRNAGAYLGMEPAGLVGGPVRALEGLVRSPELWAAWPGSFYCLAQGPENLLLVVGRELGAARGGGVRRSLIMRPYSLEREFGRMRVCLNNYLAHEIAAHLGSIAIASEFITDPELRQSDPTRDAFMEGFTHDVADLNTLFVQLLESAEPLVLPNRPTRARLDWRALVEDLAGKMRGLAGERSVRLSCMLPPGLPAPEGDYHWLYLALFGALGMSLREAVSMSEVTVTARAVEGRLETTIVSHLPPEAPLPAPWPPPSLFPLSPSNPRIGRIEISDPAVTRAIFLLHGGDLIEEAVPGSTTRIVSLPA